MKVNKYGIICALALLSGVVGCEDSSSLLDKEESNDIYENMVFSDPYNATWFLSNIYKSMNDGFMVFGSDDSGGFLGNAVDEHIYLFFCGKTREADSERALSDFVAQPHIFEHRALMSL